MRKIKFITGPAGTGKSYTLRKLLSEETKPSLVCAPTGIAALNVGGSTIHRTFKLHSDSGYVAKRWHQVERVYIDEASMMGATLLGAVLIGAPNADLILVGDMAQLPPVKDQYWFAHDAIRNGSIQVEIERLTQNYRQEGDSDFASVLNSIRNGTVTKGELRWMYSNSSPTDDIDQAITLAFRNDTVRAINSERLLSIQGELFHSEAVYTGAMKPTDCIADQTLYIKQGAKVIMLNNDKEGRWNNGTQAIVICCKPPLDGSSVGEVVVRIKDEEYSVDVHTWDMRAPKDLTDERRQEIQQQIRDVNTPPEFASLLKHYLDTGIEYVVIGSCSQYPLKLAYALTVHKSQGMTLGRTHVITSGFAGCHGIGYVALSRPKTLDDISFDRAPSFGDFKFDERLTDYI